MWRMVSSYVFGVRAGEFEIFDPVVVALMVDVMDNFCFQKRTP